MAPTGPYLYFYNSNLRKAPVEMPASVVGSFSRIRQGSQQHKNGRPNVATRAIVSIVEVVLR